ncbi:MAG: 2-oxo acid dehydrogenase subunit E2 [Chlamydiia bacterium]|nr:2-oxo acid dehydrogenase subunit E2 [Chlamydiia bacterium]
MSDIKIPLPKLGESIVSAKVVQWFKKVGDPVSLDEPLLEVSTDKVNSEIPSPVAGRLKEILAQVDEEVQVGAILAIVTTGNVPTPPSSPPKKEHDPFLSPSVMRTLEEKGIPFSEVERIPHTGQGGRLTRKDVEEYRSCPQKAATLTPPTSDIERIPMNNLRKAIADNMVRSFYQAPHASLITEVDVTPLMRKLQEQKESFFKKHGFKLTISAFVARAISRAVNSFPLINSSLENETILMKRFVNLGIAVSIDQGVMVPVIQGCQHLTLTEIARQIAELAEKARTHRLQPQDVKEGTITMTNFGMTGTMIGIPIIRYPEVAIVGLGAITKKVVACVILK